MKARDSGPYIFRFGGSKSSNHTALRQVLLARGWTEFNQERHDGYHMKWKQNQHLDSEYAVQGDDEHLINNFQGTSEITDKGKLSRNLRRMKASYNDVFGFYPESYVLPREKEKFAKAFEEAANGDDLNLWIYKPTEDGSRGRNIALISSLEDLKIVGPSVIQQYIVDPYLIGGYKFDIRVYVLVLSFRPLLVYVYRNGLVRFSTQKYDTSELDNIFCHLTNTSINKFSPTVDAEKEEIGIGNTWHLPKLMAYLQAQGGQVNTMWNGIHDLVNLTLLSISSEIPENPQSFELFGFDVMLDADLRPWLLEVNAHPRLAWSGACDAHVKLPMLHDLIQLLGFEMEGEQSETVKEEQMSDPECINFFNKPGQADEKRAEPEGSLPGAKVRSTDLVGVGPNAKFIERMLGARPKREKDAGGESGQTASTSPNVGSNRRKTSSIKRRPTSTRTQAPAPAGVGFGVSSGLKTPGKHGTRTARALPVNGAAPLSSTSSSSASLVSSVSTPSSAPASSPPAPPSLCMTSSVPASSTLPSVPPSVTRSSSIPRTSARKKAKPVYSRSREPRISILLSNLKQRVGNWELIFPFNEKTLESVQSIAPQVLRKDGYPGVALGNFKRTAVQSIRARTRYRKKSRSVKHKQTDSAKTSSSETSAVPGASTDSAASISSGSAEWVRSKAPLPPEFPEVKVAPMPVQDSEASVETEPSDWGGEEALAKSESET
eukprot:gb/GEZN01003098.1/.p1 GENE.gb/GEZN01003098.1/~~gb/GEZN01003098.1/.p1  ORF type:complete len:725 (+),score=65.58 gb/GEZN01003098.1/:25-2175(+)